MLLRMYHIFCPHPSLLATQSCHCECITSPEPAHHVNESLYCEYTTTVNDASRLNLLSNVPTSLVRHPTHCLFPGVVWDKIRQPTHCLFAGVGWEESHVLVLFHFFLSLRCQRETSLKPSRMTTVKAEQKVASVVHRPVKLDLCYRIQKLVAAWRREYVLMAGKWVEK